ncbi:MAG: hypothetical protein KBG15_17165 [Kofleriaceae bacterium]|nr:hypothetical protein [Kofleriaceae bacterium]
MKHSNILVAVVLTSITATALVGCGSDSTATPDAAKLVDSAGGIATEVPCASATPTATVTTTGFAYTPASSTIAVNQVVKFVMTAGSSHDVNSIGQGFDTGFGATKCFKFNIVGSYAFKCTPHNFTGTIVVQ